MRVIYRMTLLMLSGRQYEFHLSELPSLENTSDWLVVEQGAETFEIQISQIESRRIGKVTLDESSTGS